MSHRTLVINLCRTDFNKLYYRGCHSAPVHSDRSYGTDLIAVKIEAREMFIKSEWTYIYP